jgi:hypothetical protein
LGFSGTLEEVHIQSTLEIEDISFPWHQTKSENIGIVAPDTKRENIGIDMTEVANKSISNSFDCRSGSLPVQ